MLSKLCVFGGRGFLGKNIVADFKPGRAECDLLLPLDIRAFLENHEVESVINCAAEHGSYSQMATEHTMYLQNNVLMSINLLRECHDSDIENVLLVGSISGFPENVNGVITEDEFFNGEVSVANYGYNMSKRIIPSLVKTYQLDFGRKYKMVHLGNIFGPEMIFGHEATVVGNLIYKVWEGEKQGTPVRLFGNGKDVRSLTYVKDAAWLIKEIIYRDEILEPIIISSGYEITIGELVSLIAEKMNFEGNILFSSDETAYSRKVAKSNLINSTFPSFEFTSISQGLDETIDYFLSAVKEFDGWPPLT